MLIKYEVRYQLIKNVADLTDKLLTLQQKLKDVQEEKETKGPTTVNKHCLLDQQGELQKLLKKGTTDK